MYLLTFGPRLRCSLTPIRQVGLVCSVSIGLVTGLHAAPENATPSAASAATHGPKFFAPVAAKDFGRAPQGEPVRLDFKVENRGDAVLEIIDVRPSCGCTTAGEWTHSIKPGETGVIPVQMETEHFTGPVTKTVTVATNDPAHAEATLEFKGEIWTAIQISTPVVIFPAIIDPAQVVRRVVTIRNQVDDALQIFDVRCDKPEFKPELRETVPGKEFELMISTVPPLPEGTQTARITMKSSNPKMPDLAVQAVATVLPAVQVAPKEIMLPNVKLLAPEKRYIVLLNHQGGELEVSDLQTNVDGVELSTNTTPDKKQVTVTLTIPAGYQADGPGRRFVSGKTNSPALPTFEVPILYTGRR